MRVSVHYGPMALVYIDDILVEGIKLLRQETLSLHPTT